MDTRLTATMPTTETPPRILIAIELSKKSWVIGARTPLKAKISQFRLAATEPQITGLTRLV
jgi:hypothetical protein